MVFTIYSFALILGLLVVAQVNVFWVIWLDKGLINAIFKARETLLRALCEILLIVGIVSSRGVSKAANSLRSHKQHLLLRFNTMHLSRSTAEIVMDDMVRVRQTSCFSIV